MVADMGVFQVAKVPTNGYVYTLPWKVELQKLKFFNYSTTGLLGGLAGGRGMAMLCQAATLALPVKIFKKQILNLKSIKGKAKEMMIIRMLI